VAEVPWRFPKDFAFRNPQPANGKMGKKGVFKIGKFSQWLPCRNFLDTILLPVILLPLRSVGVISGSAYFHIRRRYPTDSNWLNPCAHPLVICNSHPLQISLCDTEYFDGKNHAF